MNNFVVQFPLVVEKWQSDILNKRFEIARKIYNSLVRISLNRYKELIKTKKYRELIFNIQRDSQGNFLKNKYNKEIFLKINQMRIDYKLSEYNFQSDVKKFQKYYKKSIDSATAQKLGTHLWRAYEKLFYDKGKEIHFKKYDTLNSLESKSNKAGIRFKNNSIEWIGLKMPVIIDLNNMYEVEAIRNDISYCRIVRKFIRGKYKFYVQIIFKGTPPLKIDKNTGEIKRKIGKGDVGIDIGTSTIAYCSENKLKILELADKIRDISAKKCRILRKMDRSKRMTNPNNFKIDGTIKKGAKFNFSNKYIKLKNTLKEIFRKEADTRKYQHECLANEIIALGDKIYVEDMNFKGLQKKSKKTEKNEKGSFKKKKRFGKSIGNRAPAMLISIIDRKLKSFGREIIKINTRKAKASQFNHLTQEYKKKSLSKRWNNIDGYKIQRDLYSSFLIMNINEDLETYNLKKCSERFDKFLELHKIEVLRLSGNKNLSSIGI
ncbi:transposase [Fusobacterium sp.]|uniref:transposase n=1 Tax=Fusobacterium sp. TaxID=68766 RepID=UPI0025C04622|nr:transposase [Fusobacterium sp.]